jgi:excisionase family DNA binding protein
MIITARFSDVRAGLYVADFGDAMKIGRSVNMISRLGNHFGDGATRGWISPPVRDIVTAEKEALTLAALRGVRQGVSEKFTGLSFEDGIETVLEGIERAERLVPRSSAPVDLDKITSWVPKEKKPVITERWMHRDEAAAYLRVTGTVIDNLVREGKIHKYTATGRRRPLFDREQIDRYVRSTRITP